MTSELQEVLLGDFFLFIQGGMVECVRELLPYVSVDQCRSELGSTALIESVKKNNIDLIKLVPSVRVICKAARRFTAFVAKKASRYRCRTTFALCSCKGGCAFIGHNRYEKVDGQHQEI